MKIRNCLYWILVQNFPKIAKLNNFINQNKNYLLNDSSNHIRQKVKNFHIKFISKKKKNQIASKKSSGMSQEQKAPQTPPPQPQVQTLTPSPAPAKATPAPKSGTTKFLDATLPFALGGLSGMTATCFIQPVDMVKVRIQIKNEEGSKLKAQGKAAGSVSPFVVIKEILASGGIKTFYKG